MPLLAELVGDAGDERRLGPDHDEVDLERQREREQPVAVVGAHRMAAAERAMPGLPGAACSSVRRGLCASRHASACSRAPEPTRSTFTRRVYCLPRRSAAFDARSSLAPALLVGIVLRSAQDERTVISGASRSTGHEDRERDDHLRPAARRDARASARSHEHALARARPTPTSSIGTSSACSTNSTYCARGRRAARRASRRRRAARCQPGSVSQTGSAWWKSRLVRREVLGLRAVAQPVAHADRQLGERPRARRASSARAR